MSSLFMVNIARKIAVRWVVDSIRHSGASRLGVAALNSVATFVSSSIFSNKMFIVNNTARSINDKFNY